jgi:hypothetical protein
MTIPRVSITVNPGGNSGGSGGGIDPGLMFAVYADVAESITAVGSAISAWGPLIQADPDAQPELIEDSDTGQTAVRTDFGLTLACSGLNFLSQTGGTIYIVARQRAIVAGRDYAIFDTSANGTLPGVQVQILDAAGSRRLRVRVSDGDTWIITHTDFFGPAFAGIKWFVAALTISATGVTVSIDNALPYYVDTFDVTLPAGASGPTEIGDGQLDYLAIEIFDTVHERATAVSNTVRLGARFLADIVWTVAYDGVRNYSFPSLCKLANGTYLGIYRDGLGHATSDGICIAANSSNLQSWTNYRTIVDLAATDGKGLHDPNISAAPNTDSSIWVTYFEDAPTGNLNVIKYTKSLDAGVTWSTPARITNGMAYNLEVASAPMVEAYGKYYMPVYNGTDESGATPWNAEVYISTNNFSTMTTVRIGTGTQVGSPGFSETGLAKMAGNNMLALLRTETDMYESFSADQGATWSTPVAMNVGAHSAARILYDPTTGDVYWLGRPNSNLRTTLFRRDAATGTWSTPPLAPGANASEGTCIYGAMLFDTAPRIGMISGSQIGAVVDDTNAAIYSQKWDTYQLRGALPLLPSPAAPPTQTPGATIQFTAQGAGNYTYTIQTNVSGGTINSGTGLYTRGSSAGIDVIRVTDLNGYFVDVNVNGTAAPSDLPDAAHLAYHFDPSNEASVTSGAGVATLIANLDGASSDETPPSGKEPGYGSTTQNSLKTLDFSGGGSILRVTMPGSGVVATADFAVIFVVKMGALTGLQALGGNGTGGIVCRIDSGAIKAVDYTAGSPTVTIFTDLTVTANTPHVLAFRRSGTAIEAWLDGVKSSVTGTVSILEEPVGYPVGNDDMATLFGEQFLGFMCEHARWDHATLESDILIAMTSLKAKWATT